VNNWVTDRSSVMQEFVKPHTPVSEDKDQESLSNAKSARTSEICSSDIAPTKNVDNDNTVLHSQSCTVNEKLFEGIIINSILVFTYVCVREKTIMLMYPYICRINLVLMEILIDKY